MLALACDMLKMYHLRLMPTDKCGQIALRVSENPYLDMRLKGGVNNQTRAPLISVCASFERHPDWGSFLQ